MNTEEKKMILGLCIRPDGTSEITKEEFLNRFPINLELDKEYIPKALEDAFNARDTDEVEYILILGFTFGFTEKVGPTLCRLLLEDWHISHEDIVSVLQKLRYRDAVDNLYKTAQTVFPYLDWDDNFALGVKCVWALYKIGTENAREKLTMLVQSQNIVIAKTAEDRIADLSD